LWSIDMLDVEHESTKDLMRYMNHHY